MGYHENLANNMSS